MNEMFPEQRARRSRDGKCFCGEPIRTTLFFRWRSPRVSYTPSATDPWYVHGSWPAATCGAPACEAEAYAELLALRPNVVVEIYTEPGAGIHVTGDADD